MAEDGRSAQRHNPLLPITSGSVALKEPFLAASSATFNAYLSAPQPGHLDGKLVIVAGWLFLLRFLFRLVDARLAQWPVNPGLAAPAGCLRAAGWTLEGVWHLIAPQKRLPNFFTSQSVGLCTV